MVKILETNKQLFINDPTRFGRRARVTKAENEALLTIAAFEKLNISETLRMCIREAARTRGLWPPNESKFSNQNSLENA